MAKVACSQRSREAWTPPRRVPTPFGMVFCFSFPGWGVGAGKGGLSKYQLPSETSRKNKVGGGLVA